MEEENAQPYREKDFEKLRKAIEGLLKYCYRTQAYYDDDHKECILLELPGEQTPLLHFRQAKQEVGDMYRPPNLATSILPALDNAFQAIGLVSMNQMLAERSRDPGNPESDNKIYNDVFREYRKREDIFALAVYQGHHVIWDLDLHGNKLKKHVAEILKHPEIIVEVARTEMESRVYRQNAANLEKLFQPKL